MRSLTVAMAAVFFQILSVTSHAQGQTDFTGRWTVIPEQSVMQGAEGLITVVVFGSDFSVQREANTLLIRVAPHLSPKFRVNLDGTPTTRTEMGPDDRLVRTSVSATWEDESLVMHLVEEVVRHGQSVYGQSRRRLTLNPDHTLRVEMPDGENGPMIGSVYRWLEPIPEG